MLEFNPRHRETIRMLLAYWEQMPSEHKNDAGICFEILRFVLGPDWVRKHFDPNQKGDGVFKISFGNTAEEIAKNYRLMDLAECLINLRYVDGIHNCVARFKEANDAPAAEAGYAELHIAKMLYVNEWPFRIIKPRNKKGDDYDLQIISGHHVRCGDTKCKLETTELSSATIEQTLNKGREQLPRHGAGVFFVKIPQTWMNNPDWQRITGQGAVDFFKHGTTRVVSIAFYVEPLFFRGGMLAQGHLMLEVENKRHPLFGVTDWRLFQKWRPPPGSPHGMPPTWMRLNNFPSELMKYGPF